MRKLTVFIKMSIILLALVCGKVLAYSFTLTTSEGGTLYLNSEGNDGQVTSYLIDTGSSLTVLNQQTFDRIKQSQAVDEAGFVVAKLANGRHHKVKLYSIPVLSLSNECQFHNVSVAVMNNQHNILGMEVLSRAAPFGIQMVPAQLTLSQCDVSAMSASTAQ